MNKSVMEFSILKKCKCQNENTVCWEMQKNTLRTAISNMEEINFKNSDFCKAALNSMSNVLEIYRCRSVRCLYKRICWTYNQITTLTFTNDEERLLLKMLVNEIKTFLDTEDKENN